MDVCNFWLMVILEDEGNKEFWMEVILYREDVFLEDMDIFKDYLVLLE